MSNKVLSVTIPSYNAEKFLEKGIATLLDERILKDIEIIIVDDGSRDKTPDIADNYMKRYSGIIKAVHKANGGHGSTINTGIELARGTYFMVVDADDWVDTENFVRFVEKLRNAETDLVLTNAVLVNSDGKQFSYEKVQGVPDQEVVSLEDYVSKIPNIEMHNYCIRTNVLRDNGVKCHEHHFYVDNEYVLYSLLYCRSVLFINLTVYHYLVGRDGQSVSINNRRKNIKQYYEVGQWLIDFYCSNRKFMSDAFKQFYEKKIAYFLSGIYSTLMSYNRQDKRKELMEFDSELHGKSKEIYHANKNLCISILRITQFKLYGMASVIYRIVHKIKD